MAAENSGTNNEMVAASIPFGSRCIGSDQPVMVIAEVGINHEGSAEVCARMIEEAAKAGADSIKLQTMNVDENYVRGTESYEIFSGASLSREETSQMFDLARSLSLEPFTTAGDAETIDWVDSLNPVAHKISSGLFTNYPAIRHAARTGRPLLMSTGMSEVAEIDAAVDAARQADASGIALFQCTSIYPAPLETLNLATIAWLERRYSVPAGFSDHSVGTEAAALSVAAGARMIEKHFTLDASRANFDHRLSLEPKGFSELVRRVRATETIFGRTGKHITEAERDKALEMRRRIVARRDIRAGDLFSHDNLALKRLLAGTSGLAPQFYDTLIGRSAARALAADEPISEDAIEGGL